MYFNAKDFLENGVLLSLNSNQVLVGWGEKEWTERLCLTEHSFFFPDYFLKKEKPFFKVKSTAVLSLDQLLNHLENVQEEKFSSIDWYKTDKGIFERGFEGVQNLISLGQLEKAVMYSASKAKVNFSPIRLLKSLKCLIRYSKNYPVYLHGFWEGNQGLLGGTPEVLFKVNYEDSLLETMALAGTVSNEIPSEIVMNDKKLIHEHGVVLNSLHSSLKAYGEVKTEKLQLLKFRELSNLYAPIKVKLKQKPSFINLVQDLHPTPALGAFPKEQGWDWLEQYDKIIPRGRFGSPAGIYSSEGKLGLCYVAIRNVAWDEQESTIFAGCGIVRQSELESEWEEVNLKINSICKTMDL